MFIFAHILNFYPQTYFLQGNFDELLKNVEWFPMQIMLGTNLDMQTEVFQYMCCAFSCVRACVCVKKNVGINKSYNLI